MGAEQRFTAFRVGDNERTNNVRFLYEDRGGQLWAGTSGGLYRWIENQGSFKRFDQGLLARPDCFVSTMTEDAEGGIWIGCSLGLLRLLQDGRLLEFRLRWPEPGESLNLRVVKADAEGRLWMLHSKGLLVFRPEPGATAASRALPWVKLTRQQACVQMLDRSQNADCRMPNDENNSARNASHLSLASGEAWLYLGEPWTSNEGGLVLHQTADRQIWIGTDLGLFAFDGATFRKYNRTPGGVRSRITSPSINIPPLAGWMRG